MPSREPATADIHRWEAVEAQRSSADALHRHVDLYIRDLPRYLNPPEDTLYPLEYCYWLLGDVRGKRVLDYGCGAGENTTALAARGADVTGLDLSHDLIKLADERLGLHGQEAEFVVGSCHDIPLADESVDVVFGMAILHHLDLELAAREVWRVLKPGGLAIFSEPTRDSATLRFVRRLIPWQPQDVSPFERPLTTAELRRFARRFAWEGHRHFLLPGLNHLGWYRLSDRLLRMPGMTHLAVVCAFGIRKPTSTSPITS
jgi:SAM-dependent methyltransferase